MTGGKLAVRNNKNSGQFGMTGAIPQAAHHATRCLVVPFLAHRGFVLR
jgi:hypothetical protein